MDHTWRIYNQLTFILLRVSKMTSSLTNFWKLALKHSSIVYSFVTKNDWEVEICRGWEVFGTFCTNWLLNKTKYFRLRRYDKVWLLSFSSLWFLWMLVNVLWVILKSTWGQPELILKSSGGHPIVILMSSWRFCGWKMKTVQLRQLCA